MGRVEGLAYRLPRHRAWDVSGAKRPGEQRMPLSEANGQGSSGRELDPASSSRGD